MNGTHVPVLVDEAIEALEVIPGKRYIDATIGLGGHSVEIIKRGGIVLGIDRDTEALKITQTIVQAVLVHGNFGDIESIAREHGFTNADGVLFDLGVSSLQLDTPKRGFSYRFTDAPLDGRMDPSGGDTAAQLVNRAGKEELYDILSTFGEEQLAERIADALCRARSIKPIGTIGDIVDVINQVVPDERRSMGVLSRVFQGIRIAVNDELGSLRAGLRGAEKIIGPGGRLVVISFHSLEDRMVKLFMKSGAWKAVTKHPIRPGPTETDVNKRSRSAKMRIAEKIKSI